LPGRFFFLPLPLTFDYFWVFFVADDDHTFAAECGCQPDERRRIHAAK
jgi:hypothetical protein